MDGFSRHHQQQQSSGIFWYPSSSPPPPPQAGYPPPPPPHLLQHAPPQFHHQQSYASQLPINPPPQHQLWFHPPQQPGPILPQASPLSYYPPPYHSQPGIPPPYPVPHHRFPPPPPPPQPHPMAPQPSSSSYPPSGQAWGNQSWQQHQLWEYPDRNIPYNNEEDWAAKARAWASADSMPESHHARSQFTQPGRIEEHEYAYRDHLPTVVTPVDKFPPPAQSNGRSLYNQDETVARETSHLTPTPSSYYPSSSVFEQEVPYTYSSSQDNRDAMNYGERPQESLHSQFIPPVQLSSVEESHFIPGNLPVKSSYDISDQPLDFQPKSTIGLNQLKQFSYNHIDLAANDGMMDQNIATTSVHAWSSTAASVVAFPTIPLAPSGTQFDPSIVSQSSAPMHSTPFGGVVGPNFTGPISPVSTPFGLGVGTSLHATNFLGDGNGSSILSERPKKAAVPNWLREELIKKKSAIASVHLLHSGAAEDDADVSRRTDQTDDKSLDSRRSIEDEEDDEDEVEAARTAAINQEIKRILTEVLLKVTDELFDEIANRVLDEDETNAEVIESSSLGNSKLSPPPIIPTPKESTKILVSPRIDGKNVDASENSGPNLAGGDLLGLANYDSDASRSDNDFESREALSRKVDSTAQHLETTSRSYEYSLKYVKTGKGPVNVDTNGDVQKAREIFLPDSREREKAGQFHVKTLAVSETSEKTSSANYENTAEIRRDDLKSLKSNVIASNEKVRRHESTNRDTNEECQDGEANNSSGADRKINISMKTRGPIKDVSGGSHRNDNERNDTEINNHGNNPKEKTERKGNLYERFGDRNVKQGTTERDSQSKSSSRSDNEKARMEISKDKVEKQKGYEKRNDHKRDPKEAYKRDEKEDRTKFARDSFKHKIRSKSPVSIGRHGKDNSVGGHGSSSSDESSDNLRKRKLHSRESSLSASPRKSTKRQVSRSPHSRHSHSRHSPYSTTRRNRRSRSISPVRRRRPSKA